MKQRRLLVGAGFLMLIGIALILWPLLANVKASREMCSVIEMYSAQVEALQAEDFEYFWDAVEAYDALLEHKSPSAGESTRIQDAYSFVESLCPQGILGYVCVPKLDLELPIFFGASAAHLERGAAHVENTSIPCPRLPTHSVISGHTGMSSARMFTDLTKLEIGDEFTLSIMDRSQKYVVDSISIVEPTDVSAVETGKEGEYVTLLTCTPLGINSHRLLVRGRCA